MRQIRTLVGTSQVGVSMGGEGMTVLDGVPKSERAQIENDTLEDKMRELV